VSTLFISLSHYSPINLLNDDIADTLSDGLTAWTGDSTLAILINTRLYFYF